MLAGVLLAWMSPGCEAPSGEVVFGISSEIPHTAVLTEVRATVTVDGVAGREQVFAGPNLDIPFEISSGELAEGSEVSLRLVGFDDGVEIVERLASTTILGDKKLLFEVVLEDECVDIECGAGETCLGGECGSADEDASALPEYYEHWAGGSTGDLCEPGGAPTVLIGEGQTDYHDLADNEVLQVEAGPQGGYHVWIAARVKNLAQSGSVTEVRGRFPDLDYEPLPLIVVFTFDPDEGDFCKIFGLRFRVDDSAHPIESLLGQTLELTLVVTDQGEDSASDTATVVLSPDFI